MESNAAVHIHARRSTCLLLRALQRRRVPGLRGAFIIASTPCSFVLVLVGDQHSGIVRLFEVSSRQCSLPASFLTYLRGGLLAAF